MEAELDATLDYSKKAIKRPPTKGMDTLQKTSKASMGNSRLMCPEEPQRRVWTQIDFKIPAGRIMPFSQSRMSLTTWSMKSRSCCTGWYSAVRQTPCSHYAVTKSISGQLPGLFPYCTRRASGWISIRISIPCFPVEGWLRPDSLWKPRIRDTFSQRVPWEN